MKVAPKSTLRRRVLSGVASSRAWVRRRVRPGFRWPIGLLIFCLGFLGFLPILGFWMLPLGLAIMAMDIRPTWRRWKAFQKR